MCVRAHRCDCVYCICDLPQNDGRMTHRSNELPPCPPIAQHVSSHYQGQFCIGFSLDSLGINDKICLLINL